MRDDYNIQLPPAARRNEPVKAADINAIHDALRAILRLIRAREIHQGTEIGVRNQTTGGVILYIKKKFGIGGGSTTLDPWQPSFFTEGSGESLTYKVRFHLGTLNGVAATNWNDAHTLSMGEDEYHFVVLTVTTSSGKVTGLAISVDSTAPSEDSLAKNTPPTTFKVILHAIGRTEAKTILRHNLTANAAEVFREGKSAPAVGAEPFERWWRWNLSTV